jgi:plastocyanin
MAAPVVVQPAVAAPKAVSAPATVAAAAAGTTTATCPDSVTTAALTAFIAHLDVAHFQRSPVQQLGDILSADQYVKTHTVLAQNMLQGLFDAISGACSAPGASPPATTPGPAPAPTGTPVPVKIAQLAFSPASVTVPVGGTVTWTNADQVDHTVTSMGRGPLGSATIHTGATYSYTFTTAGTYMYYCAVHPDMMATVVVSG